jgi:hypothetical protein
VCVFGDGGVVSNGITPLRRMVETRFLLLSDPTGMRKKIGINLWACHALYKYIFMQVDIWYIIHYNNAGNIATQHVPINTGLRIYGYIDNNSL